MLTARIPRKVRHRPPSCRRSSAVLARRPNQPPRSRHRCYHAAQDQPPSSRRAAAVVSRVNPPDGRLQERQQHRGGVAPVAAPGTVRRLVPGQRVRRPGDMQAGGRPGPGRHRRVQPGAPRPAAAVGAHAARGGRGQRVLHAGGVGRHPGGVQVRGRQGAGRGRGSRQPRPLDRQQYAGAAAGGALRRVRGGQGRTGPDTQAPAEAAAQGQAPAGRHSAQLPAVHHPGEYKYLIVLRIVRRGAVNSFSTGLRRFLSRMFSHPIAQDSRLTLSYGKSA